MSDEEKKKEKSYNKWTDFIPVCVWLFLPIITKIDVSEGSSKIVWLFGIMLTFAWHPIMGAIRRCQVAKNKEVFIRTSLARTFFFLFSYGALISITFALLFFHWLSDNANLLIIAMLLLASFGFPFLADKMFPYPNEDN